MVQVTFKRFLTAAARFRVGLPPVEIDVENLDTAGLLIEWDVQLSNTPSSDAAVVRVYNLNALTEIPLLEAKALDPVFFGTKATISFGWEKQVFECFTGGVRRIIPRIQTGVDVVSEVHFGTSQPYSIPVGAELDQANWLSILETLAKSMSLRLSEQFKKALTTNPVATTNATLTAVFNNDPKKDFSVLVASLGPGISWTVSNQEIFLLNQGIFQDETPPQILSPSTGLLSVSPLDNGGCQAQALGNPSVKPGQQILIQDEKGKLVGGAPLRVESVSFQGATNSGCVMNITAKKLNLLL